MKKLLIILMLLLPFLVFSQTKAKRYKIYYADCISTFTDTFQWSGYVRYDTIKVTTAPLTNTYTYKYAKREVIRVVKRNTTGYILVLKDTVWVKLALPTYASSYYYYQYSGYKMHVRAPDLTNYSNKQIVFKTKVATFKKDRPISYTAWAKINP